MTIASYDGYDFQMVSHTVQTKPVYTEDGKRLKWIQSLVSLNFVINKQHDANVSVADTFKDIYYEITHPRRRFTLSIDDVRVFDVDSSDDVAGGPFPRSFDIVEVMGDNTLLCRWTVELNLKDCASISSAGSSDLGGDIISNRWSMQSTIEQDTFLEVRTTKGTLVVREGVKPDNFRDHVLPPLNPKKFYRTINVTAQSDGTTLEYQIVDKEMHTGMPKRMADYDAIYIFEKSTDSGFATNDMYVKMVGKPGTPITEVLLVAIQVALSRVQFGGTILKRKRQNVIEGIVVGGFDLFNHFVLGNPISNATDEFEKVRAEWLVSTWIKEDVKRNSIEVKIKTKKAIGKSDGVDGLRVGAQLNNKDIDDGTSADPNNPGRKLAELFTSELWALCDRDTSKKKLKERKTKKSDGVVPITPLTGAPKPVPSPRVSNITVVPKLTASYSTAHIRAPYTDYRLDVQYDTDYHLIQFPVMAPDGIEAVICKMGSATTIKTVRFVAVRMGQKPKIPNKKTNDNEVIARSKVSKPAVQEEGGLLRFTITGEYVYYLKKPKLDDDELDGGNNPQLDKKFKDKVNKVESKDFVKGIISPGRIKDDKPPLTTVPDVVGGVTLPDNLTTPITGSQNQPFTL